MEDQYLKVKLGVYSDWAFWTISLVLTHIWLIPRSYANRLNPEQLHAESDGELFYRTGIHYSDPKANSEQELKDLLKKRIVDGVRALSFNVKNVDTQYLAVVDANGMEHRFKVDSWSLDRLADVLEGKRVEWPEDDIDSVGLHSPLNIVGRPFDPFLSSSIEALQTQIEELDREEKKEREAVMDEARKKDEELSKAYQKRRSILQEELTKIYSRSWAEEKE